MLDPFLASLLGPEGVMMVPPPLAPIPTPTTVAQPVVPPVSAPGQLIGPPAPMPPAQSFEPTNPYNPMRPRPIEPYQTEPMPVQPSRSVGAVLEPTVPMPRPRPASAPTGPEAAASGKESGLLKALQGVKAPEPPQAQKVSTPNLPGLRPIQGGAFFDLLASLGIGPQQALGGLKLPSTLGQSLEGRR